MKSVTVGKNKGDLNVAYKSCLFKNQKRKRIYYSVLVTGLIVKKLKLRIHSTDFKLENYDGQLMSKNLESNQ